MLQTWASRPSTFQAVFQKAGYLLLWTYASEPRASIRTLISFMFLNGSPLLSSAMSPLIGITLQSLLIPKIWMKWISILENRFLKFADSHEFFQLPLLHTGGHFTSPYRSDNVRVTVLLWASPTIWASPTTFRQTPAPCL